MVLRRPDFDSLHDHYVRQLAIRLAPLPPLRWVFRENLAYASDSNDPSVSLVFQTFRPRIELATVRKVFDSVRSTVTPLRFELLVAAPDYLLVTLSRSRGFATDVEENDAAGLIFQYEPTFATFSEVDTGEDWEEKRASSADFADVRILENVLESTGQTA